jgi:hypothetical protein
LLPYSPDKLPSLIARHSNWLPFFPDGYPPWLLFLLNGLHPGLVDIHPGDENISKDLKLLIIGFYFSFDLGFTALLSFLL